MCSGENSSEGLSFDQFMQLATTYYSDRYSRDGIKRIFQLFDEENTGLVTRETFRKMAEQLDVFLNKDDLDEIFAKASKNGEAITYDDFEVFMKRDA